MQKVTLADPFVEDPENGDSEVEADKSQNGEKEKKKKTKKPGRRAGMAKKRGTGFEGKSHCHPGRRLEGLFASCPV